MKSISLLIALTFCNSAMATAYKKLSKDYVDAQVHEIENFPLVRTQDGVGICYAATATQLLNYQYCKQNELDCSVLENQLSMLDVAAHSEWYTKSIPIGGIPYTLLRVLKDQARTLYKESCLPFELLAHKEGDFDKAQGKAYRRLEEIFNKRPKYLSMEQQMCHAKTIKSFMPIEKDLQAIINAFQANSVAQFVYEVAVRDECLDEQQKVEVPKFKPGTYPPYTNNKEVAPKSLLGKVEKLVLNDIPVGLSFCTHKRGGFSDYCGAHAATIVGVKESCNKNDCRILVKVHNSYGQSWQDFNNDGWVDGITLMERAIDYNDKGLLTWISQYANEGEIPKKRLKRSRKEIKLNNENFALENKETETYPENLDPSKRPMFRCDGNYFGQWKPDSNCKFMMYTK